MPVLFLAFLACDPASLLGDAPPPTSSADYEAFVARHADEGQSIEGAFKMWLESAFLVQSGDEAGMAQLQYLSIPLKGVDNWTQLNTNQTFVTRLHENPEPFRCLVKGTTPQNGYAVPSTDAREFQLDVVSNDEKHGERGTRLMLRCSGADSPRPVYMKQSEQTGLWYVNNYNNVYVGVRPVVDPNKETFK